MTAASDQPLPVVPTPDAADEPNRELKAIAAAALQDHRLRTRR